MLTIFKNIRKRLIVYNFFIQNKVVVFESDDWGFCHIWDKSKINNLISKGYIKNKKTPYTYFCLESQEDIDILSKTALKYKDVYNHNFKITANFIVNKPDFDAIKDSGYSDIYFTDINKDIYKGIINNNIFIPQYHGAYHYNINQWKFFLNNDKYNSRELCDNNIFILLEYNKDLYNGEYAQVTKNSIDFYDQSYIDLLVKDGLEKFHNIFGFKSLSSIAPSYYKNNLVEQAWIKNGIKYIQSDCESHIYKKNGKTVNKKTKQFDKDDHLISFCRNIIFEPSHSFFSKIDIIPEMIQRINYISNKGEPLIFCSHSYNYIGGLNQSMRDYSIEKLSDILDIITKEKNVIFLDSVELGTLIENGKVVSQGNLITINNNLYVKDILNILLAKSKSILYFLIWIGHKIINKIKVWSNYEKIN
jgi:hypothetical protein